MNVNTAVQWSVIIPAAIGVLASFLTELVTKVNAPQVIKSSAFLVLSTVGAVVSTTVWAPGESWQQYGLAILSAVLAGLAAHSTGMTRPLQQASSSVGLGAAPTTGAGDLVVAVPDEAEPIYRRGY